MVFHRMKRKFYSWEECMNLREVKVSMVILIHLFEAPYNSITRRPLLHRLTNR